MFAVLGEETGFCEWVVRVGGQATLAAPTRHGGWSGAALVYIQAQLLFGPRQTEFRAAVDAARRGGAILALELGDAGWIKARGGSQTAYELATVRPDVMFATEASAAELATPLEGIASVPVTSLESGGSSVHGRRVFSGRTGQDRAALAAAFCVAIHDGEAPIEAAGRAALVAAR